MAIDKKAFNKISAEDQKIVRDVMRKSFQVIDKQNRKDNEAAFVALKQQGIEMAELTAAQTAGWNEKTQDATDRFIDTKGGVSKATYEKAKKLLQEFRSQQASN